MVILLKSFSNNELKNVLTFYSQQTNNMSITDCSSGFMPKPITTDD